MWSTVCCWTMFCVRRACTVQRPWTNSSENFSSDRGALSSRRDNKEGAGQCCWLLRYQVMSLWCSIDNVFIFCDRVENPGFFKKSLTLWVLLGFGILGVKHGFLRRPNVMGFEVFMRFKSSEWTLLDSVCTKHISKELQIHGFKVSKT